MSFNAHKLSCDISVEFDVDCILLQILEETEDKNKMSMELK